MADANVGTKGGAPSGALSRALEDILDCNDLREIGKIVHKTIHLLDYALEEQLNRIVCVSQPQPCIDTQNGYRPANTNELDAIQAIHEIAAARLGLKRSA
jgi:hypothetical protein